jgi:predicted transcriptional regulator
MEKAQFLLWGFRAPRDLVKSGLGSLEQQVLDVVWRTDEVTVRDVYAHMDERVAYTTVMTTLDRLYRKGLLSRIKRARAFVYSAAATREQLDDMVASDLVSGLLSGELSEPLPFLSNLVDAVGDRDKALLDHLERLVKTKRRELRKRESA